MAPYNNLVPDDELPPERKMEKARALLVLDHPFFACLVLRLRASKTDQVRTMATDGVRLLWNPDFVNGLTMNEIIGVLAHEGMHCALGHMWRRGERDPRKWNVAADLVVNPLLREANLVLPEGCLDMKKYHGKAVEPVYNEIPDPPKDDGKSSGGKNGCYYPNDGNDPGGCGEVIDAQLSKQDIPEVEAEWKGVLKHAAEVAKRHGKMPSNLKRWVEEVTDPPLPWYTLLRDFVEASARNDYNWVRPSRRYLSLGVYLPSLLSEELPEVIVAIDTSGSTYPYLEKFANEASGVLQAYRTTIRVIYCDATVHDEEVYQSDDLPLKLSMQGGGGTDFRPVFEYVQQHGYQPSCMIFLTDLEGDFPAQEPDYPVMWVASNEEKAPWGTTVPIMQGEEVCHA